MSYHFITIDQQKIAYIRKNNTNANKSIIFLHPSSGSSEIWEVLINNDYFKKYDLICIDMPGHGKSHHSLKLEEDYQLNKLSSTIFAVINTLEVKNYIVVGLSFGTNLIGEIAHVLKDCRGFFLAGPTLVGGDIEPAHVLLPFKYAGVLFEAKPKNADIDGYVSHLVNSADRNLLYIIKKIHLQTDPKYREQLAINIMNSRWTDEIGNIKSTGKKVALVYGENEKISNPDAFLNVGFNKWQNKVHKIKNAGHLIHLDEPEAFSKLLLQFADEVLV